MCGIYGYVGEAKDIGPEVLESLRLLEYRGYDSWGVGVAVDNRIDIRKKIGKIAGSIVEFPHSGLGFGHTRWATHGGVTDENAHPHLDCTGTLAIVHNGIVENFRALKEIVLQRGHTLRSETDSEVIAHLLEDEMDRVDGDLAAALAAVADQLEGFSAIIAVDARSQQLVATKKVSPLVIGQGDGAAYVASDALALASKVDQVCYPADGDVVRLVNGKAELFDSRSGEIRSPHFVALSLSQESTAMGAYDHFMAKEMAEQPDVIERLALTGKPQIEALTRAMKDSYGTFFVGCGTASYAALSGAYLFSRIAGRHVNFVVGSEFKYHEHFLRDGSLVVALSQSGETVDVIDAMLAAQRRHARLGALVNVANSTLDRMVDFRVNLLAGPEQCVLSTKAYTAKVAALTLTAYCLNGELAKGQELVLQAASGLRSMLQSDWIEGVREIAHKVAESEHLFVIGRGLSYPSALEAALKIKESSYVHAEGFAGGELKHGVIALVVEGTPCIVYAPNDETRNDVLSGAMELKSRGGWIIGIGPENDPVFDDWIAVPDVGNASPLVNALPAQMIGYYAALARGNDPDKPRNLAKSVTVK